jgi:two-component system KDP operon response regulator KdpE
MVAVIEADEVLRRRLTQALDEGGFSVAEAAHGLAAIRVMYETRPQACLLDADAAGMDGLDLVRILRAACDTPVIAMVRDLGSRMTVRLLDAGAHDVVTPDVDARELVARIRSTIRSYERYATAPEDRQTVHTGDLTLDRASRTAFKRGEVIHLTRTEYRLLDALAARVGPVVPHQLLLSTVWGDAYVDDTHYLRIYIGHLRKKLEDDASAPQYLLSEWGIGYRLAARPREGAAVPLGVALSA